MDQRPARAARSLPRLLEIAEGGEQAAVGALGSPGFCPQCEVGQYLVSLLREPLAVVAPEKAQKGLL